MNYIYIAILLILFVYGVKALQNNNEHMSTGALTQLYAKGPQDLYLTINTRKYIPPYWYWEGWRHYTPLIWNNPTRFPRWFPPLYTYLSDSYSYYPYPYYY